jgi:hypothetical protein
MKHIDTLLGAPSNVRFINQKAREQWVREHGLSKDLMVVSTDFLDAVIMTQEALGALQGAYKGWVAANPIAPEGAALIVNRVIVAEDIQPLLERVFGTLTVP